MSAALLGREAIDITASLADAAAPLAMGILEFTNASDLYCRHGGLLAADRRGSHGTNHHGVLPWHESS